MSRKLILNWLDISKEYIGGRTLMELASQYNVSQWTLLDNFKKLGISKTTRRSQDIEAFNQFTKESCYWAGFLAADGWVRKYSLGITLASIDERQLIYLKDFLKSNAKITKISWIDNKTNKQREHSTICFHSKELVNILGNNFNIVPNKSLIYNRPNIPKEFHSHFIRGYIDGDGSIEWHNGNNRPRFFVGGGSLEFIKWIKEIIEINIKDIGNPSIIINAINRKNPLYSIEYMGYQVRDILNWIYEGSSPETRLERKYNTYLDCLNKLANVEKELEIKEQNKQSFINKIASMYECGMSSKEVGQGLGIGQQKVLYYLRKNKTTMKKTNNQNTIGLEREQRDLIMLEKYRGGNRPKDIAIENNLALSSFWVAIRRAKQIEAQA